MPNPSAIGALIIIAICVLPGVPGEKAYGLLIGGDWREEAWSRVLRMIGFSVLGLMLYIAATGLFALPFPPYLLPSSIKHLTQPLIYSSTIALFGHFIGATVAGASSALLMRGLGYVASRSAYGSAWEHFIRDSIDDHWVVIGLQNGDAYAGYIRVVDSKLNSPDRDVLLLEPALFDEQERCYRATEYQALFLAGATVSSIATVHNPRTDARLTQPGEDIFAAPENNNEKTSAGQNE
jgi:hypothetical protein